MRSGKLDECFDDSWEREVLAEVVEIALEQGRETLTVHERDHLDVNAPDDYVANIASQQQKQQFLQHLYECLTE